MNIKDIIEEGKARFQKEYEEAYRGILPEETLKNGNRWFTDFLEAEQLCLLEGVAREAEEIVAREMDKTEHMTNAEFIACDDLAIKIIKRLRSLHLPEHCTCASFFTVRGKHKEGCPLNLPETSDKEI